MPSNRILIYSDCFTYSGSENVIENLFYAETINKEYDIQFCFAYNKDYLNRFWQRVNGEIDPKNVHPIFILSRGYFINKYRHKKEPVVKRGIYFVLALSIFFLEFIFIAHLYNLIRQYIHFKCKKPGIIYINNGGYPGAVSCRIAVIAARLARVKNIVFNVNNMAYPSKGFFDRLLDRFLAKHVTCFVTASFAAQKQLIDVRGFKPEKFERIPNTLRETNLKIDPDFSGDLDKDLFHIGSVGLLTHRKGYHILVEAAKILVDSGKRNFNIYLIGDGEEKENLHEQIDKNGLNGVVQLLGYKSNPLSYVNSFDLFVLSSVSNEDFPYVILEAMYLSKPILGTDVAGIPEQIEEGVNGFVAKRNSAEDLSEKLLLMMDHKAELVKMGKNSKEIYIEKFSFDKVMDAYLKLFRRFNRN